MFQRADGMNYAPQGKPKPVVQPGEFLVAAAGLDHGHIYGMCNGLVEAGAQIARVYDPDPSKVARFIEVFPTTQAATDLKAILDDPQIHLVASAGIPNRRCELGLQVMTHGKDYFSDKPPLITLQQLDDARRLTAETGRKYAVYYSERLHVEAAVYAEQLVAGGTIGRVVQVVNLAPHRLSAASRPEWFWQPEQYGGIITDIGSHQIEQFLFYAGAQDAQILHSATGNYHTPQYPEFEDFGEANFRADNGTTHYLRVDWFTPEGLPVWGDGRCFIMGTDGYIELRKYIDIVREHTPDHVYMVDGRGPHHFDVHGQVGYPFFGQLILDCLQRTEKAMRQAHAFKAIELAIRAQQAAVRLTGEAPAGSKVRK
jgi:predicted dehydrogenase